MTALLTIEGVSKTYRHGLRALDGVTLALQPGQTLGLIGPSGCGKSTLARVVTRLVQPDAGTIHFQGRDWLALSGRDLRRARGAMQMVFQDPAASFHPRATVAGALREALALHDPKAGPDRMTELLAQVELAADLAPRPVASLSGGQRQRVAIARALATRPRLIVLDEAVSALDAPVRGRVLALLVRLQRELGLAYLFVGHDLAVVRAVSHHVAVMQDGRIVEMAETETLLSAPQHDLTRHLIAAVPTLAAPIRTGSAP